MAKKVIESKKHADKKFGGYPKSLSTVDHRLRYYTGKPCKRGNYALRNSGGACQCHDCLTFNMRKNNQFNHDVSMTNLNNGMFAFSQWHLEIMENEYRRNAAKKAGSKYYESVTSCKHGTKRRSVKTKKVYCLDCLREYRQGKKLRDIMNYDEIKDTKAIKKVMSDIQAMKYTEVNFTHDFKYGFDSEEITVKRDRKVKPATFDNRLAAVFR